jgi:hypothetical protein
MAAAAAAATAVAVAACIIPRRNLCYRSSIIYAAACSGAAGPSLSFLSTWLRRRRALFTGVARSCNYAATYRTGTISRTMPYRTLRRRKCAHPPSPPSRASYRFRCPTTHPYLPGEGNSRESRAQSSLAFECCRLSDFYTHRPLSPPPSQQPKSSE